MVNHLNNPENTNFLQATKYTFVVPDLPFARYFCQSVNLPDIVTNPVVVQTPHASLKLHGDKLLFGDLVMSVIIDEDLRVWEETFNWIISFAKPESFDQYRTRSNQPAKTPVYHDAILTINSNANLPVVSINFKNVHPTSLTAVNFDTRTDANEVLTATVTFAYDTFSILRP